MDSNGSLEYHQQNRRFNVNSFSMSSISKAIAAGLIGLVIAEASRYGFHVAPVYTDAGGVIVTGLVGYVVAHLAVYFAPANTPKA
ncbi:hypothetical protein [Nakamurella sp. PAMC28650]|uniref:hypothetical protein n=1 Tax=Nakamurella sp. PAMC28650 TaxID=2762325 RepID=UPI00164CF296|nr:hypothetical protein [Nakamurella sp. PAMC28650]QNK82610.1 hypothetical protein H7F38_07850 [Nakamurella sp. PAMC28650]